ncbi:MAG: dipeptidase [Pseudomonadota bacterium]
MAAPAYAQGEADLDRARAVLAEAPVFDGHNDLPYAIRELNGGNLADFPFPRLPDDLRGQIATDGERLSAGGVGAQFWSVYVPASLPEPEAVVQVIEQIDLADRLIAANPDRLEKAATAADVRRIIAAGKVAGMYGVEGGHAIGNSLGVLRKLYDLGTRYMTLTHSATLAWADSATDAPKSDGLSPFGLEVIREMNRIGMLVDLSHVSSPTMADALDISAAPIIFSHSSARAIADHPRNVPDDILARMPENGGVVMVTFAEGFLNEARRQWWADEAAEEARLGSLHPGRPDLVEAALETWRADNPAPKASIADAADHIDHIRKIAGIDHIGIGGDFDGVTSYPTGLEDVSTYPALFAELVRRGYSDDDLARIASGNILRVLEAAEAVATRLQRETGPSEMRFSAVPDTE